MERKNRLIILCAALCYPFALHAQAQVTCTPNYQVEYVACKPTTKIISVEMKTDESRVATHRCEPDDASLCEVAKGALVPGVSPADIRILKPYHKDVVDTPCGSIGNLRAKVDVYCIFQYPKPEYQMVADPTCPVAGVTDQAGCYADDKSSVDMSSELINKCLNMRPTDETQTWIKSTCLLDIYKAANAFRLNPVTSDLTQDQYKQVKSQLTILQSRPQTPPALANLIQSQSK